MVINGCDCSIIIKTQYLEKDIPYIKETMREAVSLLKEEAAIEGEGSCRAIKKCIGVTGCVVTPLTIGTAPLLFNLAMGCANIPLYVSETRNIHLYRLNLLPYESSSRFDLVQEREGSKVLYETCVVKGFELRFSRLDPVYLKLDISSERPPAVYPYTDPRTKEIGECFIGENVTYRINGKEYSNIYGLTLTTEKSESTKTEVRLKRVLLKNSDIPDLIEELTITAQLNRDKYEYRYYGMFRITLTQLLLISNETEIDNADAVIGPKRYYIAGKVNAEVFTADGGYLV
jgi:hypothetical protein